MLLREGKSPPSRPALAQLALSNVPATARPSAIPALSAFSRIGECVTACSQVASTMSPKNPSTTDGMPASISIAGLSTSRMRAGANSAL